MKTGREFLIECFFDLKEKGLIEIISRPLDRDIAKTKWKLTAFGMWIMDEKGCTEFEKFATIDKAQLRILREEFESKK